MIHRIPRLLWLVLCLLLVLSSLGPPAPIHAQGDATANDAFAMLAALNEWRLAEGLWPFAYNPTLAALARLQAAFVYAHDGIPSNIHDGVLDENPRDRATWPPYEWPYYVNEFDINLVEITVSQGAIPQGIAWWQNSEIHREAATNLAYREAGVAALPTENGWLWVAVLGGRPRVLPALLHPDGTTLYLTRETFWGATTEELMPDVDAVRLLDAEQNPLADWQDWQPSLPVPEALQGTAFYVEYRSGEETVLTEVDPARHTFLLPGYGDALVSPQDTLATDEPMFMSFGSTGATLLAGTGRALVVHIENDAPLYLDDFRFLATTLSEALPLLSLVETFGPRPFAYPGTCFVVLPQGEPFDLPAACVGVVVIVQVAPEDVFWWDETADQRAWLFAVGLYGDVLADCRDSSADCRFTASIATPPTPDELAGEETVVVTREISLRYDQGVFSLINLSHQALDIGGLVFSDGQRGFSAHVWDTDFTPVALHSFRADDCLQIGISGETTPLKPESCAVRHSWVTVPTDEIFWQGERIEVFYEGELLTTCPVEDGECIIELP